MKTSHVIALVSKIRDKANRLIISELNKNGVKGIAIAKIHRCCTYCHEFAPEEKHP